MGQYYHPINIDKEEYLSSHDYDNGLKLMEHSYIGNHFMDVIESLLLPDGGWYKNRIVWAGDYSEIEDYPFVDENGEEKMVNIYHYICEKGKLITPPLIVRGQDYKYLCNHSKKEYVNYDNVKGTVEWSEGEAWKIHPLSLLTCEGNGLGGGDFVGNDERIGEWARDVISIEKEVPEGFIEIDGTFKEDA